MGWSGTHQSVTSITTRKLSHPLTGDSLVDKLLNSGRGAFSPPSCRERGYKLEFLSDRSSERSAHYRPSEISAGGIFHCLLVTLRKLLQCCSTSTYLARMTDFNNAGLAPWTSVYLKEGQKCYQFMLSQTARLSDVTDPVQIPALIRGCATSRLASAELCDEKIS